MWTCAVLKPGQIQIALKNLERQNFHWFHPVFAVKRLVRGKPVTIFEPVFSGYLFIELVNGQRWMPINNTFGIARCLTKSTPNVEGYNEPAVIPDAFIKSLKQVTTREDGAYRLQPGTRVKILKGALISHEAIFVAMSGQDRCKLLVDLMQRRVKVEISTFDVEVVEQP